MIDRYRIGIAASLLLASAGGRESRAQAPEAPAPVELPALEAPATSSARVTVTPGRDDTSVKVETNETVPATRSRSEADRVYVTKAPPAPVLERPPGRRPYARAVWIPGNWEWDSNRLDFVWVPGNWQVAPRGLAWVSGQWQRDDRGWYWSPGYWGRRGDRTVNVQGDLPTVLSRRPTWQIEGPPARQPAEVVGAAPGPDYFHIPGHYRPTGQVVIWKPGVWVAEQPGWEWVTARWIRRPDGWDFRPGFWSRDPSTTASVATRSDGTRTDTPPLPPPGEDDSDLIAASDRNVPIGPETPVGVEPVTGMPYYMIRPPGAYPYGRNGVVVPGAVPPFVRNLLDRVLP